MNREDINYRLVVDSTPALVFSARPDGYVDYSVSFPHAGDGSQKPGSAPGLRERLDVDRPWVDVRHQPSRAKLPNPRTTNFFACVLCKKTACCNVIDLTRARRLPRPQQTTNR